MHFPQNSFSNERRLRLYHVSMRWREQLAPKMTNLVVVLALKSKPPYYLPEVTHNTAWTEGSPGPRGQPWQTRSRQFWRGCFRSSSWAAGSRVWDLCEPRWESGSTAGRHQSRAKRRIRNAWKLKALRRTLCFIISFIYSHSKSRRLEP